MGSSLKKRQHTIVGNGNGTSKSSVVCFVCCKFGTEHAMFTKASKIPYQPLSTPSSKENEHTAKGFILVGAHHPPSLSPSSRILYRRISLVVSMKWLPIHLLFPIRMLGKFARSFVRPTVTRSSRSVVRFSTSLETVTDDLKRMLIQLISPTERGVKVTNRAQIFQVIDDLSNSSVSFATEDM